MGAEEESGRATRRPQRNTSRRVQVEDLQARGGASREPSLRWTPVGARGSGSPPAERRPAQTSRNSQPIRRQPGHPAIRSACAARAGSTAGRVPRWRGPSRARTGSPSTSFQPRSTPSSSSWNGHNRSCRHSRSRRCRSRRRSPQAQNCARSPLHCRATRRPPRAAVRAARVRWRSAGTRAQSSGRGVPGHKTPLSSSPAGVPRRTRAASRSPRPSRSGGRRSPDHRTRRRSRCPRAPEWRRRPARGRAPRRGRCRS